MSEKKGYMEEVFECKIKSDACGNSLEGGENYRLHLPINIPVCNFWSIIVYSNIDNLIIDNKQSWPSIHSNCSKLHVNEDGSVDTYFGPKAPADKTCNWIQTIPGKKWYMVFRLYDPLEFRSDKEWKLGEPERIAKSITKEVKSRISSPHKTI